MNISLPIRNTQPSFVWVWVSLLRLTDQQLALDDNTFLSYDLVEGWVKKYNLKEDQTKDFTEALKGNQSVKQRTKVAKIFANEDSCLRLVSAVVMEKIAPRG
jgi:hypothetical protein